MKRLYLSLMMVVAAVAFTSISSIAQIVITPSATATTLANRLVGSGVVIIAPVLTCPAVANGTFMGTSTLSFDSGIVLTTGRAQTGGAFSFGAGGPASNFASTDNSTGGDPLLTALAGQPTYDKCILEFDFRPAGDTIKFNYVFGSEEYTSFTCTNYNDVFGFFISGTGFTGPTNIALVPGTTIPVCINSVNNGPTGGGTLATCTALGTGSPFAAYYVNNSAGTTITYDGLTTTLQAIAHVTPCDTYHLKIGIADGFDHSYDSGVFLEAGSLTSTGISVQPLGINSTDTAAGGQYCVRGCLPGQFVFHISSPLANNMSIHYVVGGSAVNGYDYSTIADSVVIPAGSTSSTLFIYPTTISPAAGPKTIKLYILSPYSCGGVGSIIDSAILNILDSFYVRILTPDTAICLGQSLVLNGVGDTSLVYSWTPSSTLTSATALTPTATPTTTTTYVLSGLFPGAGCAPSTAMVTVTVINPFSLNVGPPIQNTCVDVPLPLHVTVVPAAGSFTYSWTPTTYLTGATTANPTVTPGVAGNFWYYVTATATGAGCYARDSFLLHVVPNDFALLNTDSTICFNGIIPLHVVGDTEFTFHWEPSSLVDNANITDPTAYISATTNFIVTASYPGCPDVAHNVNYTVESPHVDIRMRDTAFCVGDSILLDVVATPDGAPYTLSWTPTTYLVNPGIITPTFTSSVVGDYLYEVTITSPIGCTSSDHVTLSPRPYAHIGVTPGNSLVDFGAQIQLDAVNLTAYPLIFYWTPNNGSLTNPNINNPIATVTDSTTYVVYAMNEWGCRDSASVTLVPNDVSTEFVPSAFTPNGDGLNDIFRISNMRTQKLVMFNVYNRWGQLVYENSTDPKGGWDGTLNGVKQDMGVYNYAIIISKPGGEGKLKTFKGEVTLIR